MPNLGYQELQEGIDARTGFAVAGQLVGTMHQM